MAAKSPTVSVKSREMIGEDQFTRRREVFDNQDSDFVPLPSPSSPLPAYKEAEPIITSNHGKTTSNFKRNTAGYSSMRESRMDERNHEFRPRKYSDNFTSELNQSDDVDYRHSMTERTRRLSKLRRDFMTSFLQEPTSPTFARSGLRASLPVNTLSTPIKYKVENLNLYKFPFAEPYMTPTPTRRVFVDLGSSEFNNEGKENEDPEVPKYKSLPYSDSTSPTKIDHQKLFEELVKRYSPQRKPVDWTLPPTRPRVIASVPKSSTSTAESVDGVEKREAESEDKNTNEKQGEDDVFDKKEDHVVEEKEVSETKPEEAVAQPEIIANGGEAFSVNKDTGKDESRITQEELEETKDEVPELALIQRQLSRESNKRPPVEVLDLTIPALIEKMTTEGEGMENKKTKKVKRKRSFLDRLLGRNKQKQK